MLNSTSLAMRWFLPDMLESSGSLLKGVSVFKKMSA
jgi:hypothetical protein